MLNLIKRIVHALPLRRQMLWLFLTVNFLFAGTLWVFADRSLTDKAVSTAGETAGQDAKFFGNLIDTDLDRQLMTIQTLSDQISRLGLIDRPGDVQAMLNTVSQSSRGFSWIGYTDTKGIVLAATGGLLRGENISARPWFQMGLMGPGFVDVHDAILLSKLLAPERDDPLRFVDVVVPVKTRSGSVVGVIGAHLNLDWFNEKIETYSRSLLNGTEYRPVVIGPDGEFRFGSGQVLAELSKHWIARVGREKPVDWTVYKAPGGEQNVVAYAKHGGSRIAGNLGWTTVVVTSGSLISHQIYQSRVTNLVAIALLLVSAGASAWALLRLSIEPVQLLMRELDQSRESLAPLQKRLGLPQEFLILTDSINALLGSLKSRQVLLEEALLDLKSSFRGVTEVFPGVLFRIEWQDDHHNFTYLSPSAQVYLNLNMAAMPVATDHFMTQLDPPEADQVRKVLSRGANQLSSFDVTVAITGRDGVRRQLRVSGRCRAGDNDLKVWDGVMVDVSDLLIARQKAAEADQAKSTFLATMSHEIRTPLNGILGFAQILLEDATDERQKSDIRKIIETSETLTRILNDILDFSKIEAGKLSLEIRPFNLAELVESCASLFHAEASRRHIHFEVCMQSGPSLLLVGDPIRLRQIMTNLLSNAMKFTHEGTVRLEVHSDPPINGFSQLRIVVSDTGIGLSVDQQQRLFQRFVQSDATIFRRFGGTGLGLAISKGLLDEMGGTIRVESAPGLGTRFDISLTLGVLQAEQAEPAADATWQPSGLRVLVVDDVDLNREMLCRFLGKREYVVREASNGEIACEMASQERFDVILMDVDMPVMSGLSAAQKIREGDGASRNAYIIALTGYAFEKDIEAVLVSGMNAHLAKPIDFKKLQTLISAGAQL
jgi:signal transduction histidine kinase/ActR/RegA family two-component response regulator